MQQTLVELAEELQAGLPADAGSRELEASLHRQLLEHAAQFESLRAERGEEGELGVALPPPAAEVAAAEEGFRQWRLAYLRRLLDLDSRLPALKTSAERMRVEVSDALAARCGAATLLDFVRQHLLRRHHTLQRLLTMAHLRQRLVEGPEGGEATAGSAGASARWPGAAAPEAAAASASPFCRLLERELEASASRLHFLRQQTSFASIASAPSWICSAVVLLRQLASEEFATRQLRHFLTQLQYLGLRFRARLWKRSLEFHAIMRVSARGEGSSPSGLQASLPLGVTSRKHLERALQELGPAFACSASLQSDKGKTFAHQVTLVFPQVFEDQRQRMEFRVYPVSSALGVDRCDEPGGAEVQSVKPGAEDAGGGRAVYYLRESGWAARAPWRPQLDPCLLEQGVLLRASYGAAHAPERAQHKEASYAQELLGDVLAGRERAAGAAPGAPGRWEADVDSVLHAEWAFLAAGDAKMVIRRLGELAEVRTRSDEAPTSAGAGREREGEGSEDRHAMPQPLVRAYFLLRHLQCRAQRWRLLDLLNFNRFLLRRIVAGLEPAEAGSARPAGRSGPGRRGEERTVERYWDLSPRTLSRFSRRCPMPFAARSDGEPRAAEQPLPRESLLRLEDDSIAVLDGAGRRVMHAAALQDLAALEREMLSLGSYYIHKYEAAGGEVEQPAVDRIGVLYDLYAAEVWFNSEKRNLLEVYLEIYEHTADALERRDLEQRIVDLMALRPRLNLEEDAYFTEAYAASICTLSARTAFLRTLLSHQLAAERQAASVPASRLVQVPSSAPSAAEGKLQKRAVSRRTSMDAGSSIVGIDTAMGSLVHPHEGYSGRGLPAGAASVRLSPAAEAVGADEFCHSACLAWKAELILEEVHHDLVRHFHPSSPLMVTLLERGCYSLAAEQWRAAAEASKGPGAAAARRAPHDDAELLLQIVRETSRLLSGSLANAQGEHKNEEEEERECPPLLKEVGGLDVGGFLHQGFAELRRKCGYNAAGMVGHMLAHLLEHLHVRRCLGDAALEVACLERTLQAQAVSFGTRLEAIRPPPLHDTEGGRGDGAPGAQNLWVDPSGPAMAAGMLSAEMGVVDLGSARSLALHCSPLRVQELRRVYQYETAYRNLVLTCVQYNALLLDPQVRQKEIGDVMLVGPSRDLIAGDAGALTMRKLRETVELSGPLRGERTAQAKGKAAQRKAKAGEAPGFMDMSRYSHHLQTPLGHLKPVLAALGKLYQEKAAALRSHTRPTEGDRQTRLLWYILLVCSSASINVCARDLSVRVQAVDAAIGLRALTALIPSRLTPFDRAPDHKQPLVEPSGTVGSVFSIPTALEILQLRSTGGSQDLSTAMKEHFFSMVPHSDDKKASRELTLSEVAEHADAGEEAQEMPELPVQFTGPATTVLHLVHGLTTLLVLRYTLATVAGDPLTLLRMRRAARFSLAELEAGQEEVGDSLSSTEPTFEALEEMCSDLARLAWRLDGLGDAARDPARVLSTLRSEVRAAHQELALLLRTTARGIREGAGPASAGAGASARAAGAGAAACTAAIQGWLALLEGMPSVRAEAPAGGTRGHPAAQGPSTLRGPLASLAAFAGDELSACDTRLWPAPLGAGGAHGEPSPGAVRSQPELTAARGDLARYAEAARLELAPQDPPLHPFVRTLLGPHAEGPGGDGRGAAPLRPQASRLPWRHPDAPLLDLCSAVCTLPKAQQRQLSRVRFELAGKREAFCRLHQVRPQSDKAAAVDAEFFGCLLLLDLLREHLGMIAVPKDLAPAADVPASVLIASSGHEQAIISVNQEMHLVRHQVRSSVVTLDQMLVAVAIARLGREFTAVVELRHRARKSTCEDAVPHPNPHSRKVDSLLSALNRLRAAGTFVQMDPHGNSGERAYVLRERDLDACVEELMASLPQWGANAVGGRERLAQGLLDCLDCRLATHSLGLQRSAGGAEGARGSPSQRDAWARSEVAGRGCRLVLEVDRLHRLVKDLHVVAGELEHRLGSEIWERARSAVAALTSALAVETGGYQEHYGERAHSLAAQLRDIREHVATGLASLASRNYAAQERASQRRGRRPLVDDEEDLEEAEEAMDDPAKQQQPRQPLPISDGMFQKLREVAQRRDALALQQKVRGMESQQTLARFFHHLKCQTLRQRFDEKLKTLHMTLESNSELSERLAHAAHADRAVAGDFTATAKGMSLAEQRIEELRAQVETDTEHRHRLQNWRRSKAKQLGHIDQAVREHQRVGAADAEGLLGHLESQAEHLRQLMQERSGDDAALEAAGQSGRQRAAEARERLQKQRVAKESARQELHDLRADVERGGMDGEARLRLWRGRLAGASERLEELKEESRRLRRLLVAKAPDALGP